MSETTEETTIPTNEELMEALTDVKDPELDMSIVELGLVYDLAYDDGEVIVSMTLTSPGCPMGPIIKGGVYGRLIRVPGVKDVDVQIVWTPPWNPKEMASEDVQMALGIL